MIFNTYKYSRIFRYLVVVCVLFAYSKCYGQTAAFTTDKTSDCDILKVNLDASSSTGTQALEYIWDFGNGNTISGTDKAQVTAVYTNPGTYTISLKVKDANGNTSSMVTKQVKVLKGPTVNFFTPQTTFCTFHTFTLTQAVTQGDGAITGYFWNIEGRGSATGKTVSTYYENESVFDVALTITDANNCNVTEKKSDYLTVKNKYKPDFTVDNNFTCNGSMLVSFTNTTDLSQIAGNNISYFWEFGDGTSSTLSNPTKQYNAIGACDVKVTIKDNTEGCEANSYKQGLLSVGGRKPKVIAKFKYQKCTETTYEYLTNGNGLPPSIQKTFDFGDGTIITTTDDYFLHTYSKGGTFYLKSTFEDPNNSNCSNTTIDTIIIPENKEKIKATITGACILPVTVNYSVDSVKGPLFYQWNFGDGTTSNQTNPTKVYSQSGNFDVSVKVFSDMGCEFNLMLKDSVVIGQPSAHFTSNGNRITEYPVGYNLFPLPDTTSLEGGCIPFSVDFKNESLGIGHNATYVWDFGDGTIVNSSSAQVNHVYTTEGIYSPKLIVTDNQGCTDTYQCSSCVHAGSPVVTSITKTGPDTVCCTFDKTFEANINLNDVDLLWYHVNSDDFPGGFDPVRKAYFKDALGNWVLDDQGKELVKFTPAWKGLHHNLTNLGKVSGDHADFYFSAYHNGCPTKIDYPKYQVHHRPWGSFAAEIPCEVMDTIIANHKLDLNSLMGNWFVEPGRNLTKAVVEVAMGSVNTSCITPTVDYVFTPASVGFDLDNDAFTKIKTQKLFPVITLPNCFVMPAYIMLTTFLYESDTPIANTPGSCMCDDQVVIVILPYDSLQAKIKLSTKKGCAPLKVNFEMINTTDSVTWEFSNGLVLSGVKTTHTFDKPGIYRFQVNTPTRCSDANKWDSIEVVGISAKINADRHSLCMNTAKENFDNKTIIYSDASSNSGGIVKRIWDFSNGQIVNGNNAVQGKTYTIGDMPSNQKQGLWTKLTVQDNNGCSATDSTKILLRTLKPSYTFIEKKGCMDTLIILPTFPNFGQFPSFNGTLFTGSNAPDFDTKTFDLYDRIRWPILLSDGFKYNVQMQAQTDSLGMCLSEILDTSFTSKYDELKPGFKILSKHIFNCVPAFLELEDTTKAWNGASIIRTNWQIYNIANNTSIYGGGVHPGKFALADTGYYNIKIAVLTSDNCERSLVLDSAVYIRGQLGSANPLPDTVCVGKPIQFEGKSFNAKTYFWDYGDGSIEAKLKPTHSYSVSGIRVVAFVLTDTSGDCKIAIKDSIYIKKGPVFYLGNDTVLCKGKTLLLSTPVNSDYSYLWNTGSLSSQYNVINAGKYSVTVTNTKLDCALADTIDVKFHELIGDPLKLPDSLCEGNSLSLKALPLAGVVQYIWTSKGKIISTIDTVNVLADSNYTVALFLKDSIGCILRDSIDLPVYKRPEISLSGNDFCPEKNETIIASSTKFRPEWMHAWSKNGIPLPTETTSNLIVNDAGIYDYMYGTNNCKSTKNITLSFLPRPIFNLGNDTVLCKGTTLLLSTTSNSDYSYLWNTGSLSNQVIVNNEGKYSLTVTNTKVNCSQTDSIYVKFHELIGDPLKQPDSLCEGNNVSLKATHLTGVIQYIWTSKGKNISTKDTVNVLADSNYTVALFLKDSIGCILRDSIELPVYKRPEITLQGRNICPGEYETITTISTKQRPEWLHSWSKNGTALTQETTSKLKVNDAGFYEYIYGTNNCKSTKSITLSFFNLPVFSLGPDTFYCKNDSVKIEAKPISNSYQYLWNTGTNTSFIYAKDIATYTLNIKDTTTKCQYGDSIKVNYFPIGEILDPIDSICLNNSLTIQAKENKNVVSWQWNHNGKNIGQQKDITITSEFNYTLFLYVRDKQNCPAFDSIKIPVYAPPKVTLNGKDFCPSFSTILQANAVPQKSRWKIQWFNNSGGLNDSTFEYTTTQPNKYWVKYGENGCFDSDSISVKYYPVPNPKNNPDSAIFCEENGTITLDGGVSDFYLWQKENSIGRYINIDSAGVYTLQLENKFGCKTLDSIIVENKCRPLIFIPDAFSPNADNTNDFFTNYGYNIGSYEILIFNRWGEIIYQCNDISKPWDGNYRGEPMPSGTYPWIVSYSGTHKDYSAIKKLNGSVTLLR